MKLPLPFCNSLSNLILSALGRRFVFFFKLFFWFPLLRLSMHTKTHNLDVDFHFVRICSCYCTQFIDICFVFFGWIFVLCTVTIGICFQYTLIRQSSNSNIPYQTDFGCACYIFGKTTNLIFHFEFHFRFSVFLAFHSNRMAMIFHHVNASKPSVWLIAIHCCIRYIQHICAGQNE